MVLLSLPINEGGAKKWNTIPIVFKTASLKCLILNVLVDMKPVPLIFLLLLNATARYPSNLSSKIHSSSSKGSVVDEASIGDTREGISVFGKRAS